MSSLYFNGNIVETIGSSSFFGCTSLTGSFPTNTDYCDIGDRAFYDCSFTNMVIYARSIGGYAFAHNLKKSGSVRVFCGDIKGTTFLKI